MIILVKTLQLIFVLGIFGLSAGLEKNAHAEPKSSSLDCTLGRYGDCCHVNLDKDRDVKVSTAINSSAAVDFVVIENAGNNDCVFKYDGEMQATMQSYVGGFIGTWLGGNFTLHYQNDAANSGTCALRIYYMNIGSPLMTADSLGECSNNRFDK